MNHSFCHQLKENKMLLVVVVCFFFLSEREKKIQRHLRGQSKNEIKSINNFLVIIFPENRDQEKKKFQLRMDI
jgi:hypothetical protein